MRRAIFGDASFPIFTSRDSSEIGRDLLLIDMISTRTRVSILYINHSMVLDLAVAYVLMLVAQSRGPAIIELLHGIEARQAAEALPLVEPDSEKLCEEYEAAHWNATSDILHTAGMVVAIVLLLMALKTTLLGQERIQYLAWIPPVFYLPAWLGHFIFQKDIPAVFSYGTTLSGWAKGEYCSYLAMFAGRTLKRQSDWIPVGILSILLLLLIRARVSTAEYGTRGKGKRS